MAYNEEGGLPFTVQDIETTLEDIDYEILIVNDGSNDRTGFLAEELAATNTRISVVSHPTNLGLGGVYRTGFSQSRGNWLTFMPADGEFPASNLLPFLEARQHFGLLLGVIPDRKGSYLAFILTFLEKLLYRLLFGTLPPFQGLFMIRRTLLAEIPLKSEGRGWAILMELFLKTIRSGQPWCNIPTVMRNRHSGRSKVRNLRTVLSNLWEVLNLARTMSSR